MFEMLNINIFFHCLVFAGLTLTEEVITLKLGHLLQGFTNRERISPAHFPLIFLHCLKAFLNMKVFILIFIPRSFNLNYFFFNLHKREKTDKRGSSILRLSAILIYKYNEQGIRISPRKIFVTCSP